MTVRGCTSWPARWRLFAWHPNPEMGRTFLCLLHHYGKFLTGLAMLLHPLNHLLKAGQKWTWTKESTEAFEAPKKLLVTAPVLAHYDSSVPIKIPGDTSAYSIGAVIPTCTLIGANGPSHMHHEP